MSTIKDNKYIWIAFWMWLSFLTPAKAASGEIDVQDIVFSHIQDAYTWHITEWNGQEIAIPISFYISLRRLFTRRIIGDSRPHHTTRRVRNNRLCSSNSIRTDKKRPSKQRPPFRERPLCQQTYLFENTSGYGHSFGSKRNIRFGESRQTVARHHRTRRYTR